ncbi:MAG: carboxynorspermidine decarboxylase [Gammaproteobacteria bacterium]|nr:carboxynorspermidine decarboxylase [Gammaproteobacteria bacterium]
MHTSPRHAERFRRLDLSRVPSPCFVVDEVAVEENLAILGRVQQASGARILLALKAFSMWHLAPLIMRYLRGTCASGIHEARLGREEYGGEVHTFSPGFTENELARVLEISDHVVFNSPSQWARFKTMALAAASRRNGLKFGLRVNPEHSEGDVPLYDPCAPYSRLGMPRSVFPVDNLQGISGLHFHTLCEQDLAPLQRTVAAFEERFGEFIPAMQWINFGGGHHITRDDYDVDGLIELLRNFRQRHGVELYLEPGEAIAINTGVLVAEVVDLPWNGMPLAILDTSATCHMPDTLEMPYRAEVIDAGLPGDHPHTYRLGGQTCLAGDVIGDYSFAEPLTPGRRLAFQDMSHYTMVKTTTFNGIGLPSIAIWNSNTDALRVVRQFGYEDFRNRLS